MLARQDRPLHRPGDIVLRVRGHEATQDADMVRAERRPAVFAFAGIWTPWRGARGPKSAPIEGNHELFGFLTTNANAIVAPIHPKAMPVILTTPDEVGVWLEGETLDALVLQKPLPDDALRIVAKGEKEDPPSVRKPNSIGRSRTAFTRGWQTCPQSSGRLVFAGFRYGAPTGQPSRFLNDTTAPGARLRALSRRRPVPVNT